VHWTADWLAWTPVSGDSWKSHNFVGVPAGSAVRMPFIECGSSHAQEVTTQWFLLTGSSCTSEQLGKHPCQSCSSSWIPYLRWQVCNISVLWKLTADIFWLQKNEKSKNVHLWTEVFLIVDFDCNFWCLLCIGVLCTMYHCEIMKFI